MTIHGRMLAGAGYRVLCVLGALSMLLAGGPSATGDPSIPGRIIASRIDRPGVDRLMKETGSPMVIVMMASWCGPCLHELPSLVRLNERYGPKGIRMVGLSFEFDGISVLQSILDRKHVNFPVYAAGQDLLRIYKIKAIPALFFLKDGKIVERIVGMRGEKFLEQQIIHLLE